MPSAADIDYNNVDEIVGYYLLAETIFANAGGFDYPREFNHVQHSVETELEIWSERVKAILDKKKLPLGNIPQLLRPYDLSYRILKGKPCDNYIKQVRLTLVGLWLKGNKSISQTDIVTELLKEIFRSPDGIEDKYREYAYSVFDEWVRELQTYSHFRNIPQGESFNRLALVMRNDIYAYYPDSTEALEVKTDWFNANLIDDISGIDTPTLNSYINFLNSAPTSKIISPQKLTSIRRHYLSRPDLNPYYRQAIAYKDCHLPIIFNGVSE